MTLKEAILKNLEENRGRRVSGEALAEALGVSRAAVWKAVSDLRAEGHVIEAATNSGYSLSAQSGLLSRQGIAVHLGGGADPDKIHVYDTVKSTNITARALLTSGAARGTVVLAETQSEGRGRRGRAFYSPRGSLYCSFILEPPEDAQKAPLVTVAAAVAVCRAVEALTELRCRIKWVNDIVVSGRKICGISTEAITDLESGGIESIILGIGINLNRSEEDFPADLREIAGAVALPAGDRCRLAAGLIERVFTLCAPSAAEGCVDEYRERSCVLGKPIYVLKNDGKKEARAVEINEQGNLTVEYADGERETLRAGEISVRARPGL